MALPRSLERSFSPAELEFIASNETISIVPRQKLQSFSLMGGKIPETIPPLSVEVPVWLALILKKHDRCNIPCPEWLTVDNLKQRLEEEEKNAEFSPLPFHYMELSHMLLDVAADDIPDIDQVHNLLKDLRETRQAKTRAGLGELDSKWLGMNNISMMELNEIRPFFTSAFEELKKLDTAAEE
ncbi:DNA replication complex GINS protein psf2 [Pilobolus umbonatus]|nr:DNA replication complex GINS protein psf2 [Pilobolus umbonatus]